MKEFSVCQWFEDGQYEYLLRFVGAEEALSCAYGIARSIGGRSGTTRRILVTDGGDSIVWEWKYPLGVVWPPREVIEAERVRQQALREGPTGHHSEQVH